MALADLTPADRHRELAGRFAAIIEGTPDWTAPTPVAEWTARDVVQHLVDWLPGLLGLGSDIALAPTTAVAENPIAVWQERCEDVQAVLDDGHTARQPFRSQLFGELTIQDLLDRFYTADIFMHGWDLARATGQEWALDEDWAAPMLAGMRGMEETIRQSGQFGTEQPVTDDASVGDQLVAFIGRDPNWAP